MAIHVEEIVVPDDATYTSNRRYTSRRSTSRSPSSATAAMLSKFDINSLNHDAAKLSLFGGSFIMLVLCMWVFLYSFAPSFVRYSKKSCKKGMNSNVADPLRTLGWSIFLSIVVAIVVGVIYSIRPRA